MAIIQVNYLILYQIEQDLCQEDEIILLIFQSFMMIQYNILLCSELNLDMNCFFLLGLPYNYIIIIMYTGAVMVEQMRDQQQQHVNPSLQIMKKRQTEQQQSKQDMLKKRKIQNIKKIYIKRKRKREPILAINPTPNPIKTDGFITKQVLNKAKLQAMQLLGMYKKQSNGGEDFNQIQFRYNYFIFLNFLITQINTKLECLQIKINQFHFIKKNLLFLHKLQISLSIDEQKQILRSIKGQLQVQFLAWYQGDYFIQKRYALISKINDILQNKTQMVFKLFPSKNINISTNDSNINYSPPAILQRFVEIQTTLINFLECAQTQIITIVGGADNDQMMVVNSVSIPKIINKILDFINHQINYGDQMILKLSQAQIRGQFIRFQIDPSSLQQIWGYCMSICGLIRIANTIQLDLLRNVYKLNPQTQQIVQKETVPFFNKDVIPNQINDNHKQMVNDLNNDLNLTQHLKAFNFGRQWKKNANGKSDQRIAQISQTFLPQPAKLRLTPNQNLPQNKLITIVNTDDIKLPQNRLVLYQTRYVALRQQLKNNEINNPLRKVYSQKNWDNVEEKNTIVFSKSIKYIYKIYAIFVNIVINIQNNILIQNFVLPKDLTALKNQVQSFQNTNQQIKKISLQTFSVAQIGTKVIQQTRNIVNQIQKSAIQIKQLQKQHQIELNNINSKIQKLNIQDVKKQIRESLQQLASSKLKNVPPNINLLEANLKLMATKQDMKNVDDHVNIIQKYLQNNIGKNDYGPKILQSLGYQRKQISDILKRDMSQSIQTFAITCKKEINNIQNTLQKSAEDIKRQGQSVKNMYVQYQNQNRFNMNKIEKQLKQIHADTQFILKNQETTNNILFQLQDKISAQYKQSLKNGQVPIQHLVDLKNKLNTIDQHFATLGSYLMENIHQDIQTKLKQINKALDNQSQIDMDNNQVFINTIQSMKSSLSQQHLTQIKAIQQLGTAININTNKLYQNGQQNQRQMLQQFHAQTNNIISTLKQYQQRMATTKGQERQLIKQQFDHFNINLASWMAALKQNLKDTNDENTTKMINQINNNIKIGNLEQTKFTLQYMNNVQSEVKSGMTQLYQGGNRNYMNLMTYLTLMESNQGNQLTKLFNQSNQEVSKVGNILHNQIHELKFQIGSRNKLQETNNALRARIYELQKKLNQIAISVGAGQGQINTKIAIKNAKLEEQIQKIKQLKKLMNMDSGSSTLDLIVEVSKLKDTIKLKKLGAEEINKQIQKSRQSIARLKSQLQTKSSQIASKQNQLSTLKQASDRTIRDIQNVHKSQLQATKSQINLLERNHYKDNQQLKSKIQQIQQSKSKIKELQRIIESNSSANMESKMRQLGQLKYNYLSNTQQLEDEKRKHKLKVSSLQNQIQSQKKTLVKQIQDLNLRIGIRDSQYKELQAHKNQKINQFRPVFAQKQRLQKQSIELKRLLKQKQAKIEQMNPTNTLRRENQINQRKMQIQKIKIQHKNEQLKATMQFQKRMRESKLMSDQQNNNLKNQIGNLNKQHKDKINELKKEMQSKIKQKQKQIIEIKGNEKLSTQKIKVNEKEIYELRNKILQNKILNESNQKQIKLLESKISQITASAQKQKNQRSKVQTQIRALRKMQQKKQESVSQLTSMKQKLDQMQAEKQKQRSKVNVVENQSEYKQQITKLKIKNSSLEDENTRLAAQRKNNLLQNQQTINLLKSQLTGYKEKISSFQDQINKNEKGLLEKQLQYKNMKQNISNLQIQLKKKKGQISNFSGQKQQLQAKLSSTSKLLTDLKKNMTVIEDEKYKLQRDNKTHQRKLKEKDQEIMEKEERIHKIQDENKNIININKEKMKSITKQLDELNNNIKEKDGIIQQNKRKYVKQKQQFETKQKNITNALNGVIKDRENSIKRMETDIEYAKKMIVKQLNQGEYQTVQQGIKKIIQRKKEEISQAKKNFDQIKILRDELEEKKNNIEKQNTKILKAKAEQQQILKKRNLEQKQQIEKLTKQLQIEQANKLTLQSALKIAQDSVRQKKNLQTELQKKVKEQNEAIQKATAQLLKQMQQKKVNDEAKIKLADVIKKKQQTEAELKALIQSGSKDNENMKQLRKQLTSLKQQRDYFQLLSKKRQFGGKRLASVYETLNIMLINQQQYIQLFLKQHPTGDITQIQRLTLSTVSQRVEQFKKRIQQLQVAASQKPLDQTEVTIIEKSIKNNNLGQQIKKNQKLDESSFLDQSAFPQFGQFAQLMDQAVEKHTQNKKKLINQAKNSGLISNIYLVGTTGTKRSLDSEFPIDSKPTQSIAIKNPDQLMKQIQFQHQQIRKCFSLIVFLLQTIYNTIISATKLCNKMLQQIEEWKKMENKVSGFQLNIVKAVVQLFTTIFNGLNYLISEVQNGFTQNGLLQGTSLIKKLTQLKQNFANRLK